MSSPDVSMIIFIPQDGQSIIDMIEVALTRLSKCLNQQIFPLIDNSPIYTVPCISFKGDLEFRSTDKVIARNILCYCCIMPFFIKGSVCNSHSNYT